MNHIEKRNLELRKNLMESYSPDNIQAIAAADFLEKGKKANLGEIREWAGGKVQKTTTGWKPVGETKSEGKETSSSKFEPAQTKESIKAEYGKKLKAHSEKLTSDLNSINDQRNTISREYRKTQNDLMSEQRSLYGKVGDGEITKDDFNKRAKEISDSLTASNEDFNKKDAALQEAYQKTYKEGNENGLSLMKEGFDKIDALKAKSKDSAGGEKKSSMGLTIEQHANEMDRLWNIYSPHYGHGKDISEKQQNQAKAEYDKHRQAWGELRKERELSEKGKKSKEQQAFEADWSKI